MSFRDSISFNQQFLNNWILLSCWV